MLASASLEFEIEEAKVVDNRHVALLARNEVGQYSLYLFDVLQWVESPSSIVFQDCRLKFRLGERTGGSMDVCNQTIAVSGIKGSVMVWKCNTYLPTLQYFCARKLNSMLKQNPEYWQIIKLKCPEDILNRYFQDRI